MGFGTCETFSIKLLIYNVPWAVPTSSFQVNTPLASQATSTFSVTRD